MSKLSLSLSTQPSHCNLANPGKQKGRPSLSVSFSSGFQRLPKTSAERLEYGEGMCDRLSSGYWIMSCHHTPRLKDVLRIWVSIHVTYCPEGWNLESVYVPPMWKSPKGLLTNVPQVTHLWQVCISSFLWSFVAQRSPSLAHKSFLMCFKDILRRICHCKMSSRNWFLDDKHLVLKTCQETDICR